MGERSAALGRAPVREAAAGRGEPHHGQCRGAARAAGGLRRGGLPAVRPLLILSHLYGVYGAFAAQPASDVIGVFIAGGMLLQVYRRYPVRS